MEVKGGAGQEDPDQEENVNLLEQSRNDDHSRPRWQVKL